MRKLIILLVFLPFMANAQVKISALPEATTINSSDLFILNQSGTTKKLPYSLLTFGSATATGNVGQVGFMNSSETNLDFTSNLVWDGTKLDIVGNLDANLATFTDFITSNTIKFTGLGQSTASNILYINSSTGSLSYGAVPQAGVWDFEAPTLNNNIQYTEGVVKTDNFQIGTNITFDTGANFIDYNSISYVDTSSLIETAKLKVNSNNLTFVDIDSTKTTSQLFYNPTSGLVTYADAGNEVSLGTDNQIPFTDSLGTDFDYSSNFAWDGKGAVVNSGTGNCLLGYDSGDIISSGIYNTAIGYLSSSTITTGGQNVLIGNNTSITTGSKNVLVGSFAGSSLTTTSNNTFLGYSTGRNNSGNGNIFIGYETGYNETGSNKLYIENSNSATPLIYGEFDNDLVKINGYLDADSGVYQVHTGMFGRCAAYDIPAANTWYTIQMDTVCQDRTTSGFEFNSDSTGIIVKFDGVVDFSGHASFYNNAATTSAGVYIRLMINSVEQSEFNTAVYRSFTGDQFHDLTSFAAPVVVNTNDTISVQGRVTDDDLDLQGSNTVFDKSDAFTISLIEILKKP